LTDKSSSNFRLKSKKSQRDICTDLVVTVTKTITKSNCASFTQTIIKTESNYGILYDTIVEFNVDSKAGYTA